MFHRSLLLKRLGYVPMHPSLDDWIVFWVVAQSKVSIVVCVEAGRQFTTFIE